jgi:MYXO-CTERM domain-containing protein
MGNICNASSGVCVVGCLMDSDCMTGDWCDSPDGVAVGMCQPKIANGNPLPSMPTSVSTCSAAVGARVCQSGVCDKDNECGLVDGDGPCTNPEVCRSDMCNTMTMLCGGTPACTTDADCHSDQFCKMESGMGGGSTTGNACVPKLPIGDTCSAASQCLSNDCSNKVCSGVIGSGNGLICAAGQPGGSNGGAPAGLLGLALAAVAVARRRRQD